MYDVVALGELLIDFAPVSVDGAGYPTLAAHPGGAPANYLAAAARFGLRTAMIGKVGQDMFGRLLRDTLAQSGVDTRALVLDPERFTTLAFVSLDGEGNRDFSFARKPGADTCLTPQELPEAMLADSRVFHFGSLSLTDEPARSATWEAVRLARKAGALISVDPNLRRPLWRDLSLARRLILESLAPADVVKLSDEEADFLWGATPEEGVRRVLEETDAQLVFVTMGAKGCLAATRRASASTPVPPGIRPVDTTGAGDIFGGAALSRLLATGKRPDEVTDEELRGVIRFACAAASLSTTRYGGISGVPKPREVEALLAAWQ